MNDRFSDERGGRSGIGDYAREAVSIIGDASLQELQRKLNARLYDIQSLQVPPEQGGKIFGFGKRIVVPADQVHVVSGSGLHASPLFLHKETEVFGQAAGKPAVYWRNALSEVIALRTITFVIPVAGANNIGVDVLDKDRVPYNVTAHVVAKLDETKPALAAQSVGNDIMGLAANIREVTEAQLLDAAAEMSLEEVLNDRQKLADKARDEVNDTLSGLGYKLLYITIAELGGGAFEKLVRQAQAAVTRDTTTKINTAELATNDSNKAREREEADVAAQTRKETEAKRLEADQAVETAALDKQETVAARENVLHLADQDREKQLANARHSVALQAVALKQDEDLAAAKAEEAVALERQTREKERLQAETKADADREDLQQSRDLVRAAEKVEQDAERLLKQETAAADRAKEVKTTGAEADAKALEISTKAETDATLLRASTEATAAEKQAAAKTKMAEATRAESAATGLADADVQEREIENAAKQVEVTKAEGVATAEVAKLQAEAKIFEQEGLLKVEMDRLQQQAKILAQSPAMFELEQLKLTQAHELSVRQAELNAQVQIAQVIAPQMDLNLNLIGDGSRVSQLMSQVMAIAYGANIVGQEVPVVGNLLGTNGSTQSEQPTQVGSIMDVLPKFLPFINQAIDAMEPKVFSTLTVRGLLDALGPVVSGQSDLVTALNDLKERGSLRVIADLPVAPILSQFGIGKNAKSDDAVAA